MKEPISVLKDTERSYKTPTTSEFRPYEIGVARERGLLHSTQVVQTDMT